MKHFWALMILSTSLLASTVTPKAALTLLVDNLRSDETWARYTVKFNAKNFNQFRSCLCNNYHTTCCTKLSWGYEYHAQSSDSCGELEYGGNNLYNTFECTLKWSYYFKPSIECSKETKYVSSPSIYFNVGKRSNCELSCVNIRWHKAQILRAFRYWTTDLKKGECRPTWSATTTLSLPPTTTASYLPPTTTTTSTTTWSQSAWTTTPATTSQQWLTTKSSYPNHTTATETHTQTTTSTTSVTAAIADRKVDSEEATDNLFIVAVYTVAGVILIIAIILSVLIWRRRRKRQTRPTTTSQSDVWRPGTISPNHGERREENVQNSSGASSERETSQNESNKESNRQGCNAEGGSCVSTEEIIRNKRATSSGFPTVSDERIRFTGKHDNVSEAQKGPDDASGVYTNTAALGAAPGTSSVYSRLGDQIRIFENPYNDYKSVAENATVKSEREQSTAAIDSVAKSSPESKSSNQNEVPVNATRSVSQSFVNKAYEDVNVENINSKTKGAHGGNTETRLTLQSTSDGTQESAEYTNIPKRNPGIGTEESEYTNFPKRDPEPTQSIYTRLGEPVRDIENPYDG